MSDEVTLPPNWRAARDSDGKEYYFNELTGETSWAIPEEAGQQKPALTSDSGEPNDAEFAPAREGNDQSSMMAVPDFGASGGSLARGAKAFSYLSSLLP